MAAALASLLGIDEIFSTITPRTPGCAVAVSRNGSVVAQGAYGSADLNLNVPLAPESVFYIASDSKQFTAFAVALLADEGKLRLGDSIVKWLPELPAPVYGNVTIGQLVHHTSGVRDYWGLFDIAGRPDVDEFPQDDFLRLMARQSGLNFRPGARFEYSNSGYALLAVIASRAAGEPFGAFAEDRIFRPLGMTHTSFGADHRAALRGLATGYRFSNGRYESVASTIEPLGDGGLRTTVGDLMLWMQNLDRNRLGRNPGDVAHTILEPGTLTGETPVHYAFGLAIGTRSGFTMYDHDGSYAGYRSFVAWLPKPRIGIATLCNAETPSFTPWDLGLSVLDRTLGVAMPAPSPAPSGPNPVVVKEDVLAALAGTYLEPDGTVWKLTVEDGKLRATVQGIVFGFEALSPSHFRAVGAPQRVELLADARGVSLHIGSQPVEPLVRFTAPRLSSAQLADYTGAYYSGDVDLTLYVTQRDGALYVRREGALPDPLQAVARDEFRRRGQDLRFERKRGRVTEFRISASGADGVPFERR